MNALHRRWNRGGRGGSLGLGLGKIDDIILCQWTKMADTKREGLLDQFFAAVKKTKWLFIATLL